MYNMCMSVRPQFHFRREERSHAPWVKKLHFLCLHEHWRPLQHTSIQTWKQQQSRGIKYSMYPRLKQTTQGNILFWMLFKGGKKENTSWLALITAVEREIERFFWSGHGSANVQRRDVRANAFGVVLHSDIPLFTPIRLILKTRDRNRRRVMSGWGGGGRAFWAHARFPRCSSL